MIIQTPQLQSIFTEDSAGIEEVGVKSDTLILTNSLLEKAVQNRHNTNETNILFMVKGQRLTNSSSTFCVHYFFFFISSSLSLMSTDKEGQLLQSFEKI